MAITVGAKGDAGPKGALGIPHPRIPIAVRIAERAVDKQAQPLLMPVVARHQLNDLPDELWTKINIEFYKNASEADFKSLAE